MAKEKDITERTLEDYNDVFADIVNTVLFKADVVKPEDLHDTGIKSQLKTANAITEQERDTAKLWKNGTITLSLLGLENQTEIDPLMPPRVQSYEGGDVRYQIVRRDEEIRAARQAENDARLKELQKKKLYPVVTVVLYYGMGHWTGPKSTLECMDIVPKLLPYVNDCHINVVEVAWLTEAQRAALTSDFKIVADYFYQMRVNKEYDPPIETIKHVDAVLGLMYALTGNRYFEEVQVRAQERIDRGEQLTMRDFFGEAMSRSRSEGISIGRNEGITIGEQRARKTIMENLIAGGMDPQQAARYTGLNG